MLFLWCDGMEKEYNLSCIDYAISKTVERALETPDLSALNSSSHFSKAILGLMFEGNAKGFSSKDGGRNYIKQLSFEDFEEALLKHVVKSKNAKLALHKVQLLGVRKNFGDAMTNQEVQELIYESFETMHMDSIKYLLNKYPYIYQALAETFVEERYFNKNLGMENLDMPMVNRENSYYYDKIDSYYKERKNEQAMGL